jgi:nucleotide-binding universal stress UspA family protein
MKVLLATDGSPSATHAEELVAAIAWPQGTQIDVLSVEQFSDAEFDLPAGRRAEARAHIEQLIDQRSAGLVQALSVAGRTVRARLVSGRPATVIVEEAEQLGSDLVVIGSHDHGALASFVLGSVSAEVVDHTPCPVLVARRSHLGPIVLGLDGSAGAEHAEKLITAWPFLARERVHVVTVSRLVPWYGGSWAGMGAPVSGEVLQELVDAEQAESQRLATEGAARLAKRGVAASALVELGAPADGLLEAITSTNGELVVVGSHGSTGLTRVLLGSVARSILYQAPCSVLIARQQKPSVQQVRSKERVAL